MKMNKWLIKPIYYCLLVIVITFNAPANATKEENAKLNSLKFKSERVFDAYGTQDISKIQGNFGNETLKKFWQGTKSLKQNIENLDKNDKTGTKFNLSPGEATGFAISTENSPELDQQDHHYSDVSIEDWAYQAVEELTQKYEVLKGLPDGAFHGQKPATRYEMAQALVKTVQKLEQEQVKLSALEEAAIISLREEFNKEIVALAARVEYNETHIDDLGKKHKLTMEELHTEVQKLEKRHYFVPELRFRYGFGDYDPKDGTHASTRLRLNSVSKLNKDTLAVIRLQAENDNLINRSEVNGDITDVDLTLAYIQTGVLTRWIPKKAGKIDFFGGILPPNQIFYVNNYTACVDQRGFNDANPSFSFFNTQINAFGREVSDGRRMSIGGEYIKTFNKYDAKIQAFALRSTGGSLNIMGKDIISSGDESTLYAVSGQIDVPVKKQPFNLKLTHFYSFGDRATNQHTYSVGGRVSTKFENIGVVKAAIIGHGGAVPPRNLGGIGGCGLSYQIAFNPAIKAFRNLFGNPDEITYKMPSYVPGKTEVGFGYATYQNSQNELIRAIDVYISRYFTSYCFGRIIYSHANPNVDVRGLTSNDSLLLEAIFKI